MKRGSNQYQIKPRKRAYVAGFIFIGVCLYMMGHAVMQFNHVDFQFQAHAPTLAKVYAYTAPTPTPTPSQHDLIVAYIKQTFGKDAPKAFHLLQDCGENGKLDPNAVNTYNNYPVGSRDIGVFMVNEYWQKIQAKFLFNWKINIQVAYQLFKENDNSFKLWTGGRRCGI